MGRIARIGGWWYQRSRPYGNERIDLLIRNLDEDENEHGAESDYSLHYSSERSIKLP